MPAFFPRQTIAWHLERPGALRALTLSLVECGLLTGVVIRLLRALVMPHAMVADVLLSAVLLMGLAVLHLSNYPVRHWAWRAPAFGALAAVGEMLTSIPLILVHREPWGTGRAELADWPQMAWTTAVADILTVTIFALVLGAVVQVVRYGLVQHEQRGHTLSAIHEERVRERKSLD
jgi:hypothetical protein